jgi:hypothetical protein
MSPIRLADSGGSSTGPVHGRTTVPSGIRSAVHTTHTPYDPYLQIIHLSIGDVDARQAP